MYRGIIVSSNYAMCYHYAIVQILTILIKIKIEIENEVDIEVVIEIELKSALSFSDTM